MVNTDGSDGEDRVADSSTDNNIQIKEPISQSRLDQIQKLKEDSARLTAHKAKKPRFPIIRMKNLKIDDYYSAEDKEKDIAAIGAFFDNKNK